MENVKNLVSKKFKPTFDKWCEWLEGQGYTNYWQVLNAKDYGVPQNRERVFMISILGVHEPYVFPEKQELHIRLKDVLEKEVDSKFYVKEEKIAQFLKNVDGKIDLSKKRLGTLHKNNDMQHSTRSIVFNDNFESLCLTATMCKDAPKVMVSERLFGLFDKEDKKNQAGGVYNKDKLSPTLSTMQGGWQQPLIIDDESMITIRKLTPKECWRLMGFDDSDFEKAEQVNSNTQLYKQAGNSIVVNCLEGIFYELFKNTEYMEVESENVA